MATGPQPVSVGTDPHPSTAGLKGLKGDAIGFGSAVVVGVASTAPGYSLAAVLGLLVAAVGFQAPAALLVSFIPMFFIAFAYLHMSRADPESGTVFSWMTRSLGPYMGWIGGWASTVGGFLVIGSLADVASRYTFLTLGLTDLAQSKPAVMTLAVAYILLITWLSVRGIELSARFQNILITAQVAALLIFAVVALVRVFNGTAGPNASIPTLNWFNPFAISSTTALVAALLLGVFLYWGWEASVNLVEETKNGAKVAGIAAVSSTVLLVTTYVLVAVAVLAFAGVDSVQDFIDDETLIAYVANQALGGPLSTIVLLAVVTSALAAAQTTIIPGSRITLSMAWAGALPKPLSLVHPSWKTPWVTTLIIGLGSIAWYVPVNIWSVSFLYDTIGALSLLAAFYLALTGFSCVYYYRYEVIRSVKNFLFIGVAPTIGSLILTGLLIQSVINSADPAASYTGVSILGMGVPLFVAIAIMTIGVILMLLWRLGAGAPFFQRRREVADPDIILARMQ